MKTIEDLKTDPDKRSEYNSITALYYLAIRS